jgi:PAP2 superfamily
LAGLGIADTVSNGHLDLNHGLVSSLYNPYAAIPSMHIGYAVIVATSLLRHGRHLLVRALGALYPPFVLLVIVATGNHFFFDAAAGALVASLAATASALITRPATTGRGHSDSSGVQPTPARRAGGVAMIARRSARERWIPACAGSLPPSTADRLAGKPPEMRRRQR